MKKYGRILSSITVVCIALGIVIFLIISNSPVSRIESGGPTNPPPAGNTPTGQPLPQPTSTATRSTTRTPTRSVNTSEYLRIFEEVWSTINQTYFDPKFGGLDWNAVHAKYEPLIQAARNEDAYYLLLNQMLWELKVSHTGVGPAEAWLSVEPVIFREGTIGVDVRLLDGTVVITRVDPGSPAEKAGLKPGFIIERIESNSIAEIITDTNLGPPYNEQGRIDILTRRLLSVLYGDSGTCVALTYRDDKDQLRDSCIQRSKRGRIGDMGGEFPPSYLEFENRRLESGIGYIRFNTFHPDLIPDFAKAVAAFKDAPGIIIDLRGNPGGNPDTVEQMAAQFLDGRVLFGFFRTRTGDMERSLYGKNVYPGPLVILIDSLSFSGSEMLSSGMQTIGRAVIIGERSPGGLTAMNIKTLSNNALLGFPVAQLITPKGKVLEGVGVIPEITVPLTRNQLLKGIDAQLQAAVDVILKASR